MYIYLSNHLTDDCLPCPHSTRTTDLDTVMPSKTPTFAIIWPGWFGGFLSVPNGSVESRWVIVRLYQFIPAMNLQWITFSEGFGRMLNIVSNDLWLHHKLYFMPSGSWGVGGLGQGCGIRAGPPGFCGGSVRSPCHILEVLMLAGWITTTSGLIYLSLPV